MNPPATIKTNRGSLTFQLASRQTKKYYPDKKGSKYIYLGLPDTDENQILARIKLKVLISDLDSGKFDPFNEDKYKSKETFEESLHHKKLPSLKELMFLEWNTKYDKGIIHESTYKMRIGKYKNFLNTLSNELTDLKSLENAINSHYESPRERVEIIKGIITSLTWALMEEVIPVFLESFIKKIKKLKNDYSLVSKKKNSPRKNKLGEINKEFAYFSKEERDFIIQEFYNKNYKVDIAELVEFIFCTGVRTQEAFGLNWGDIHHDRKGFITVSINKAYSTLIKKIKSTKNNKVREFKVSPRVKNLLERMNINNDKSKDELIFKTTNKGFTTCSLNAYWYGYYSSETLKFYPGIVYKLSEEGKISKYLNPYQMRATFITNQLLEGKNPLIIAKWTGHDTKTLLDNYEKLTGMEESPAD